MSRYIYTHPKEAYLEERKVIIKTCERRCYIGWIQNLFLLKTFLIYLYRKFRYALNKNKFS